MSDPSGQGQPTPEEIEAYYAQLREAPTGDLLMQCVGMLASGAEAKLGRPDARVLIDSLAALVGHSEPYLGENAEQLKSAVSQLQMAQVQLERQQQGQGEAGEGGGEGAQPGDPSQPSDSSPSAGPDGGQAGQTPPQPAPGSPQPQTSKLWIPGQGS